MHYNMRAALVAYLMLALLNIQGDASFVTSGRPFHDPELAPGTASVPAAAQTLSAVRGAAPNGAVSPNVGSSNRLWPFEGPVEGQEQGSIWWDIFGGSTNGAACTVASGVDFLGGDAPFDATNALSTNNADECCSACQDSSGCVGFTWTSNNGYCYLKGGGWEEASLEGAYSGTNTGAGVASCNVASGVDFLGGDAPFDATNALSTNNADECCSACQADSACAGFTWTSNNGYCYFKGGGWEEASLEGAYSGTISGAGLGSGMEALNNGVGPPVACDPSTAQCYNITFISMDSDSVLFSTRGKILDEQKVSMDVISQAFDEACEQDACNPDEKIIVDVAVWSSGHRDGSINSEGGLWPCVRKDENGYNMCGNYRDGTCTLTFHGSFSPFGSIKQDLKTALLATLEAAYSAPKTSKPQYYCTFWLFGGCQVTDILNQESLPSFVDITQWIYVESPDGTSGSMAKGSNVQMSISDCHAPSASCGDTTAILSAVVAVVGAAAAPFTAGASLAAVAGLTSSALGLVALKCDS